MLRSIYGGEHPRRISMKFEKRIRALEACMITDPVILHFADGNITEIRGQGDFLRDLFAKACSRAELSPVQTAQLDLIRKSVRSEEPGGGHMIELLNSILDAPVEPTDMQ
jgi:hypothetical protein